LRRALTCLALALCVVGCQPGAAASFQPEGACVVDGRTPGTYPSLEAKLPAGLGEDGARSVDSGRSCTDQRLSTLKAHGVTDLRFAGATWTPEGGSQTVIAVFTTPAGSPPLQAEWMEEFYEAGAQKSTKTENIEVSHPTYDVAGQVFQLNTLNDLSFQSVVVWPGPGFVHVVIVATELKPGGQTRADHDDSVRIAVLWGGRGGTG
jgi:hypothetical protein